MSALTKFTAPTGQELTAITYKGQPCWIAQEIGQALEYSANGSKLVNKITQDWSGEMFEGVDYYKIEGEELATIKAMLGDDPPDSGGSSSLAPKVARLLLLTEQGVFLACIKTNKPAGITLRRWLASEVLPALRATGTYTAPIAEPTLARKREERLTRKQELEERKYQADALATLVDRLEGRVDAVVLDAYRVVAVEIATGRQLGALKPAAPEGVWMSPTEIATDLGTSVAMVGKVISHLGLRSGGPHARKIINKAQHSARTVESWLYDDEWVELIREELVRRDKITP